MLLPLGFAAGAIDAVARRDGSKLLDLCLDFCLGLRVGVVLLLAIVLARALVAVLFVLLGGFIGRSMRCVVGRDLAGSALRRKPRRS